MKVNEVNLFCHENARTFLTALVLAARCCIRFNHSLDVDRGPSWPVIHNGSGQGTGGQWIVKCERPRPDVAIYLQPAPWESRRPAPPGPAGPAPTRARADFPLSACGPTRNIILREETRSKLPSSESSAPPTPPQDAEGKAGEKKKTPANSHYCPSCGRGGEGRGGRGGGRM